MVILVGYMRIQYSSYVPDKEILSKESLFNVKNKKIKLIKKLLKYIVIIFYLKKIKSIIFTNPLKLL